MAINKSRWKAVSPDIEVLMLTLQGNCLLFWVKAAHSSGHLLLASPEEKARIESELHLKDAGEIYSNRLKCACGSVYGAFGFLQQGIRQHDRDMVGAILEFENTSIIRVNVPLPAICPNCSRLIVAAGDGGGIVHYYFWAQGQYGCCSGEI